LFELLAVLQFVPEDGLDLLAELGDDAFLLAFEGLFELGELLLMLFLDDFYL